MKNKIHLLILFLVCSVSVLAQTLSKTEANADFVEYTDKDGLPSTNYSDIVQTNDGYIWFSGIEGTYRFDGYNFDEVGKEYGLPDMQAAYYDSSKNLLYFASPQKFIVYDGKTVQTYEEDEGYKINGLPGQTIELIKPDSKGRIWIGSSSPFIDKEFNGGLTLFESGTFTVFDSTTFPLHNVDDFIETPYGDLIFSSNGKNPQTSEGSYIALFKNGKFKRIDESEGFFLQNAQFLTKYTNQIDNQGNTWIPFMGVNTFWGIETDKNAGKIGLAMYDGNEFHVFPEVNTLLGKSSIPVSVHYSSKMDKLFLTSFNPSATEFGKNNNTILEYSNGKWKTSSFFQDITSITKTNGSEIPENFKYIGSYFTKENETFPEMINFISTAENQRQSSVYPAQHFSYENKKWTKIDAFNGDPILQLDEGYLFTTAKGFGIYYNNKSKLFNEKDGLKNFNIGFPTLYPDRNGIVWITYSYSEIPAYATISNYGVNIWDGESIRFLNESNGLKSNTAFNVFQDTQNRIWITTDKGISLVREIQNSQGKWLFKLKNINSDSSENYNVTNILETSSGDIYTWQNFERPEYGNVSEAEFFLGKYSDNIIQKLDPPFSDEEKEKKYKLIDLKEGYNGQIWLSVLFADELNLLGSQPTKVFLYNGKTWSTPPASWQIPNELIRYVGKLDNGMYFLTQNEFYNFNGDKFIPLTDSIDANADFSLLKAASVSGTKTDIQVENRLFIRLRNKGLAIFDGKNLSFYTKKNGLPSANISNPVVDFRGNLTFGFPSGALVINEETFQAYYDDESVATGGPASAVKDLNGNLIMYYTGVGLYKRVNENKKYSLKISSVTLDTTTFFQSFPNELNFDQNSVIFNFSALNFKFPNQTTYEYILEGYDKKWSLPRNLNFAQYQNLPPGDYNFRVIGITSNGIKTNEANYIFEITPPLWQRWWAYLLYLISVALLLVFIRETEKRKLKKKELERIKNERAEAHLRETELRAEAAELQAKAAEAQAKMVEVENQRKSQELEEARTLQLSMLPKELPKLSNLDIAVYMRTATEVGGDYYDYHLHEDGTLTVVLGDATGHGMRSGMMVSIMKSLFMSDRSSKELEPFFVNTNKAIKDMHLGRLMMALSTVQIKNYTLKTINAGMPPILRFNSKLNEVEEIISNQMPLGAMKDSVYTCSDYEINKNDVLMLLSDGFPELTNQNDEMIGYEMTQKLFLENAQKPADKIVDVFNQKQAEWLNTNEPKDDITFVIIKIK